MILRNPSVAPTTNIEIGVAADAEVRPVNMRMGAIGGQFVGALMEFFHIRPKIQRIELHDPRHGARIGIGMLQMGAYPVLGYV